MRAPPNERLSIQPRTPAKAGGQDKTSPSLFRGGPGVGQRRWRLDAAGGAFTRTPDGSLCSPPTPNPSLEREGRI